MICIHDALSGKILVNAKKIHKIWIGFVDLVVANAKMKQPQKSFSALTGMKLVLFGYVV